ncbi:MAG TPA: AI-2E family transporter [Oscillatoriaceae cyanobacterium]
MESREKTAVVAWLRDINPWSLAKGALAAVVIVGLARVAFQLWDIWLLVAGGLLLATLLHPAVSWLEQHKVRRPWSIVVIYALLLGAIALLGFFLVPMVYSEAQLLVRALPAYFDQMNAWSAWLAAHSHLDNFFSRAKLADLAKAQLVSWAGQTVGYTRDLVLAIAGVIAVLFFALFLLLDGDEIRGQLLRLLPRHYERLAPRLLVGLQSDVGGYLRGVVVLGVILGALVAIGLWILRIPYALLIGIVAGLLEVVPYLGPFVAGTFATLAGLSVDYWHALWALLFFVGVQHLESYILAPFVLGRYTRMSPFWISLAVFIGLALAGIPGGLVAMPAAIVVRVFATEYLREREAREAE